MSWTALTLVVAALLQDPDASVDAPVEPAPTEESVEPETTENPPVEAPTPPEPPRVPLVEAPEPEPLEPQAPPPPAAPPRRGPNLPSAVGAGVGALIGALPWVPSCVVCCGASALMALVYPLSRGSPAVRYETWWPQACMAGVIIGMWGWVLALAGTLGGTVLTAGGVSTGVAVSGNRAGPSGLRRVITSAAIAGTTLALLPVALVAAALSGFLPWASMVLWSQGGSAVPTGGPWLFARWFMINAVFMSAVTVGLGLLLTSVVIPVGGALAAWLVASFALPS